MFLFCLFNYFGRMCCVRPVLKLKGKKKRQHLKVVFVWRVYKRLHQKTHTLVIWLYYGFNVMGRLRFVVLQFYELFFFTFWCDSGQLVSFISFYFHPVFVRKVAGRCWKRKQNRASFFQTERSKSVLYSFQIFAEAEPYGVKLDLFCKTEASFTIS